MAKVFPVEPEKLDYINGRLVFDNNQASELSPEDRVRLDEALARLSPREREVFELVVGRMFSHRETARMLGISHGNVQTLLQRAWRKLAVYQEGDVYESTGKTGTQRLAGHKYDDIAAALGVYPTTVKRWMTQPVIKAEMERQKREIAEQARDALVFAATRAVHTLVDLLDSEKERMRFDAALAIIDRLDLFAYSNTHQAALQELVASLRELRYNNGNS
ncbi:sigma-70 family RNA polymerase sigma factor [Thermosyntropha lipolytica]|nr:sigma-70 family RNA polymerase sigma factor [Thermosyntropha lipolytica]